MRIKMYIYIYIIITVMSYGWGIASVIGFRIGLVLRLAFGLQLGL